VPWLSHQTKERLPMSNDNDVPFKPFAELDIEPLLGIRAWVI
jgi:hypothetical protein